MHLDFHTLDERLYRLLVDRKQQNYQLDALEASPILKTRTIQVAESNRLQLLFTKGV